jgi:hypothetical protein
MFSPASLTVERMAVNHSGEGSTPSRDAAGRDSPVAARAHNPRFVGSTPAPACS